MPAVRLLLAASFAFAAAPVLGQGSDELWDMSTRMEMAGMPGQTFNSKVCMKKGQTQPDKMSQDKNCKVLEQRTVGNKVIWKIECAGRDPMTGEGEITRTKDKMDGKMRMQGKHGKDAFDMTTVMSGKLVGTCDAEEQNRKAQAAIAAGGAQLAKMCKDAGDRYASMNFDGANAPCAAQKAEYCARVTKTTQPMRTAAGYREAMKNQGLRGQGLDQAGKVCSVNTTQIRAEACKGAMSGRDWPFVGEHCPAEAKKIAAEHCAGRSYTAVMASEYKAVCQQYARREPDDEQPASAAAAQQKQQQANPPAAPSAADTVKDSVKEGANQLRKLFGR